MRRAKLTRRKVIVGLLVLGALVEAVIAVAVFAQSDGAPEPTQALPLHPVAGNFKADDTKLEDCSARTCFEQAFGNIAYTQGAKVALTAFDDKYGDFSDPSCHRVVHKIGSASLARNKGNVARTFAQGSSSCFSGYYHGVLERSLLGVRGYNPDTLGRVARDLCDDDAVRASLWFTYQCLHGLGHGLMITSGYTLPLSLKVCDRLSTGWDRTSCNGGVFMENISTLYGVKSSWLRDDDPVYPCNVVAEEDKIKCYEIVTSRVLRVVGGDWAKTSEICADVEKNWVEACFRSLGRDTAGQAHQDPAEIRRLCALAAPSGGEKTCLDGAARAMTGNSRNGKPAAVLCNSIALGYQARCFYGIGSVMALYGSTRVKREADCRSVTPSANYVAQCIRGGQDYLRLTGRGLTPQSAVTSTGVSEPAAAHDRTSRIAGFAGSALDRWGLLVAVAGAVLIGAALRLVRLGERVLSFDEAYTVATAQRPFLDMLATFRFEANGTLYAVLLWPLLRISESEAMVRTPALIAGLATIPALFWAARELVGHRAALVAAALVAVSPAMIGWSVYGRGYAYAILFAVLSFGCLARALDTEEPRPGVWRGLFVLATLAMAYSSAVAAVTLLPVHAVTVVARAGRTGLRAWIGAALALAVGLLPLAILLYVESTYRDPLAWLWKPDLALLRRVGGELVAGPAFLGDDGAGLAGAIVAASVATVLVGFVLSRRRAMNAGSGLRVVLGWAFFPPLLLFVVSQVRPMLWGRYLGIVVPALAVLLAVLIVRSPKVVALCCGAALASFLLIASLMTPAPQNDFREAAAWMESHRRPAEPVVVYPIEQLPAYAYYARTLRVNGDMPVEEWNDTRLPEGVVGYRRDYDWGDSPVGPPTDADLARLASRTGSVLVLSYPTLAGEIPTSWAEARGCVVAWSRFDGLADVSMRACRLTSDGT